MISNALHGNKNPKHAEGKRAPSVTRIEEYSANHHLEKDQSKNLKLRVSAVTVRRRLIETACGESVKIWKGTHQLAQREMASCGFFQV